MMLGIILSLIGFSSPVQACQMEALIVAKVYHVDYDSCQFKVSDFSYYAPSTLCPLKKSLIRSSGVYVPGYCKHINLGDSLQGVVFYNQGTIQLDL